MKLNDVKCPADCTLLIGISSKHPFPHIMDDGAFSITDAKRAAKAWKAEMVHRKKELGEDHGKPLEMGLFVDGKLTQYWLAGMTDWVCCA